MADRTQGATVVVKFENGHEGFVSEAVAAKMEKKGQVKILRKAGSEDKPKARGEAVDK